MLTKELESVVQEQVKTGLYKDAGEIIRNSIRQTYCGNEPDPYLDSAEIAEKVRHARNGSYRPHHPGEFDRILQNVVAKRK